MVVISALIESISGRIGGAPRSGRCADAYMDEVCDDPACNGLILSNTLFGARLAENIQLMAAAGYRAWCYGNAMFSLGESLTIQKELQSSMTNLSQTTLDWLQNWEGRDAHYR